MKPSIFLLALAVITITSCTSAYKTGQTPDDVYFSPQKQQSEYVAAKDRDDDPGYYNGTDYYGDRYLRMKVQNRYQWSDLDDYYYNDRYSYGGFAGYSYYNTGLYMNNPWSPVSYWNYYYNPYYSSYYNPYYSPIFVIGNKGGNGFGNGYTVTNRPRVFNLNTYNNNQLTNGNYTNRRFDFNSAPNNVNTNNYNNNYRNSRTNAGGFLRNAFGSGNNNNNYNSSNDNSRSYNNSNNNSSSSGGRSSSGGSSGGGGSSSGSSAPVRKF